MAESQSRQTLLHIDSFFCEGEEKHIRIDLRLVPWSIICLMPKVDRDSNYFHVGLERRIFFPLSCVLFVRRGSVGAVVRDGKLVVWVILGK